MKKALVTAVIVGTAILSPLIGMGISQTREAILGLAPDQAVLELADKIDSNRVSNDQKLSDLQTLVSTQQATIDGQNKAIEMAKSDVKETTAVVVKNKDCGNDIGMYCNLEQYRNPSEYASFKASTLKSCSSSGSTASECKNVFNERYAPNFEKCQAALSCN